MFSALYVYTTDSMYNTSHTHMYTLQSNFNPDSLVASVPPYNASPHNLPQEKHTHTSLYPFQAVLLISTFMDNDGYIVDGHLAAIQTLPYFPGQ